MARLARVVAVDLPHHVTHRGNRRGDIFLCEADRTVYITHLRRCAVAARLDVWAYCLMTNHVHLIVVPRRADSLAGGVGLAHRHLAVWQNKAQRWQGHLWANRYFSTPLDARHLWACVRYVQRNPVRAGIVARAQDYPWSSARSHATGAADGLLSPTRPFPGPIADWSAWLAGDEDQQAADAIRAATRTGRPCGDKVFVQSIGEACGRDLEPQPPGRKPGLGLHPLGQGDLFEE